MLSADEIRALIETTSRQVIAATGLPERLKPTELTPIPAPPFTPLAQLIDHTRLKPETTPDQVTQLCQEARTHDFASVCVNPVFVPQCADLLAGSSVVVCTVIGFPLGATTTAAKVAEAQEAIANGASEIDMVMPIGLLKAAVYDVVLADIEQIVQVCKHGDALCKVIIETALLSDAEKVRACLLAAWARADFVKTSTGFAASGAVAADVALLRQVLPTRVGVKASGGIRTLADARAMLAAGANRLGTSSGVQLVAAT